MLHDEDDDALMTELERMDRFYSGEEEGDIPLEILRSRGIRLPEDDSLLDDAAVTAILWEAIRGMAEIGMFLESTDHLSDRELYRYLVNEGLREETMLPQGTGGMWVLSPIGGFSEEDIQVYLRYYADDEERASFRGDYDPLPSKEALPYDRDRLLPRHSLQGGEPQ